MTKMTCRFLIAASLAVVFTASASSIADSVPPPDSPVAAQSWEATQLVQPSSGLQLGSFRLEFEKTTLGNVQTTVGVGTIAHRGDAGDSVYWLCYTVAGSGVAERIWLLSSAEMGGDDHEITGVSARLSHAFRSTPSCPALPARLSPVQLDHHLWLGSSAREVSQALGHPSHRVGSWAFFDFQGKTEEKCEDGLYDLLNGLALRIENELVTGLAASQVTSC
jgi:hypothetical protein